MLLHKTFIIKPTMNCNLRCRYCYEFNKNGDQYCNSFLKSEVLTGFVLRIARLFPESRILWLLHGGEPLLVGIEYLRHFINSLRDARSMYNVDFQFALQTNATLLTDNIVELLEQNGDLLSGRIVSISIDGPKRLNDKARMFCGGKSSFDPIVAGLNRMAESKLGFSTICVVGEHNVHYPQEVYAFIKGLKSRLTKFIPCYNFDINGCCEKLGVNPLEYAKFICKIFDLWIRDLPDKTSDDFLVVDPIATILSKLAGIPVTWCEYRKEKCDNFISIYPDGGLWLCDTMDNTMKEMGYVGNLFELSDDPLRKCVSEPCKVCHFEEFQSRMTESCRNCDISQLCNGGCLPMRDIIFKKSKRLFQEYCEAKHLMFSYIKDVYKYAMS